MPKGTKGFQKGHKFFGDLSKPNFFKKGFRPLNNFKKGHIPWNKGIPMTESTRKKVSDKKKIMYSNPENHPRWKGGISKELRKFYAKRHKYQKRHAVGTHSFKEWEALKKEWNYCCARCGMQEPFTNQQYQRLTEDHIIPLIKGGSNNIDNIQPLCKSCNSWKNNKTIKYECHKSK